MVTANMLCPALKLVCRLDSADAIEFSPRSLPYCRVPYTREPQVDRQAIQKGCPTRRSCFAIGSHGTIVAKTSWFSPTGRGARPQPGSHQLTR